MDEVGRVKSSDDDACDNRDLSSRGRPSIVDEQVRSGRAGGLGG